jgi:hypothetical protein
MSLELEFSAATSAMSDEGGVDSVLIYVFALATLPKPWKLSNSLSETNLVWVTGRASKPR